MTPTWRRCRRRSTHRPGCRTGGGRTRCRSEWTRSSSWGSAARDGTITRSPAEVEIGEPLHHRRHPNRSLGVPGPGVLLAHPPARPPSARRHSSRTVARWPGPVVARWWRRMVTCAPPRPAAVGVGTGPPRFCPIERRAGPRRLADNPELAGPDA